MLLQFVFSLAVLGTPRAESEFAWADALDKLAPHMAGFKASADAPRRNTQRLQKLIDKLHLGPRTDPKTKKPVHGLYLNWDEGVFPVAGVPDATFALITWGSTAGSGGGGFFSSNVFRKVRGKWTCDCVGDDHEVFPRHVLLTGNTLVVSGLADWMSNGANVAVRSYRLRDGMWVPVATAIAEYESWDPPKLRLAKNGRDILPVRIQSRTYPRFMSACHATAHLTYEEEWRFVAGRPKAAWKKLRHTPYNVLDRLYDAIRRRDAGEIGRRSLNGTIAKRLLALYRRSRSGEPDVLFPRSYSYGEAKVLCIKNLQTVFHFGRHNGHWVVTRLEPLEG
jgi:hypothetical protein